jgi:predicted dehydrogenase
MTRYTDLAVLVVGLGSMGRRRVRNMQALGIGRIIGFDTREDRRQESEKLNGIETVESFDAGTALNPDALVISTPPHRHLEYAHAGIDTNIPFFMEANCFVEGMADLVEALHGRELVAAPSRTLWFIEGVKKAHELLDTGALGTPAMFQHHCGHALPLWHPWEDYREFYGGWKEAKGAGWDMIGFELYALTYLFGPVKSLSAMYGKRASFDTPVDDTFQINLEFAGGTLGHAMIEVVSPVSYRTLRIVSEKGVIAWDHVQNTLDLFTTEADAWTRFTQDAGHAEPMYHAPEEPYIEEMDAFFKAVVGETPYPATFEDELGIMRLVDGVRESQEAGRRVEFE